ncbi:protein TonB [Sphingomonas vulcanisoli]|uniref:Protein TonB n=1 Tax=Sphingomonas vulcanisoli TaxID=1658060 RepID=A0ABX0TTT3_9SPHN|nr:hypothetical protein [Sphingomonas vulcanisoli]NIJ08933.1 protein TonB [Sphingomonas vulcanisoli]
MTTPASQPSSGYGNEWSFRQRAAAFVISVLINLLILWILLTLAPRVAGVPGGQGRTLTFNVSNDNSNSNAAKSPAKAARAAKSQAHKSSPVPQPVVPPPIPLPPRELSPFIELSQEDFHKSDIGKIQSSSSNDKGETAATGGGAGDSQASGSAPNGEPLYNAEWYRRPTDAEINGYMPKRNLPPGAWAEIACKTMPRFHVDECVALGDSPPGYGLARAIQQAGWQFLVRPPRVGGKMLVGAWVRIRIDFYEKRGRDEEP